MSLKHTGVNDTGGSITVYTHTNSLTLLPQGKKVGASRCDYVFDGHTSKDSKRLKVVLLHLWRINVKTTGGFINIPVEDFHMVKTAP